MAWGLTIRQSGLLQELSQVVSDADQLLTTAKALSGTALTRHKGL